MRESRHNSRGGLAAVAVGLAIAGLWLGGCHKKEQQAPPPPPPAEPAVTRIVSILPACSDGDPLKVLVGDTVKFSVTTADPEPDQVAVWFSTDGGRTWPDEMRIPLQRGGRDEAGLLVWHKELAVNVPVQFRVKAGLVHSRQAYPIIALPRPRAKVTMRVTPPDYTGLPTRTVSGVEAGAPVGSRVEIAAETNVPPGADGVRVEFGAASQPDATPMHEADETHLRWEAARAADQPGDLVFRVAYADALGHPCEDVQAVTLHVLADTPPRIELDDPPRDLAPGQMLELRGLVSDDYAVTRVRLAAQAGEGPTRTIELGPPDRRPTPRVQIATRLDPVKELGGTPGGPPIRWRVEAVDNCPRPQTSELPADGAWNELRLVKPGAPRAVPFALGSDAFKPGAAIPQAYTGEGADMSPGLSWQGVPAGTRELALIVDDPDAGPTPWVHWVIYRIPVSLNGLKERAGTQLRTTLAEPRGVLQGLNSWPKERGNIGYRGPFPPTGSGVHHYRFTLYALDQPLAADAGLTADQLHAAMAGHVLATATLTGTYERK
ncbi:MAG: hypothetical protein BIFFINMI_03968 [Phycisphaerae bacterium]|nr:hypothetical protein [Phycisphaerae bacterium]